ncbi:MAG: hypothetical protein BWY81_00962 [Firmicutes bacterium ADurb.Bin467]|nr:MAG: hypothetical protein BWY81_00962 [Firmicutes bacterium ADurb.Bin467]
MPVFENGELVCPTPPLSEIRSYVRRQLEGQVWEEEQRFENPHEHYLDMSPKLYELKMGMLDHPQI